MLREEVKREEVKSEEVRGEKEDFSHSDTRTLSPSGTLPLWQLKIQLKKQESRTLTVRP